MAKNLAARTEEGKCALQVYYIFKHTACMSVIGPR
jgi:hypothetical protein